MRAIVGGYTPPKKTRTNLPLPVVGYESATISLARPRADALTPREESGAEGSRTLDLLNAIVRRGDSRERARPDGRRVPSSTLRGPPAATPAAPPPAAGCGWRCISRVLQTTERRAAHGPGPAHTRAENTCHSPGTPFSVGVPRGSNAIPEPATRSRTVLDTRN